MCVCNQIPIYWRNISTSERSEAIFVLPQPSARTKSRAANPRVLSEISIARRLGVWMIPRFGRIRMQAIGFAGMADERRSYFDHGYAGPNIVADTIAWD